MNLLDTFTTEQKKLLNETGITIQDKDYSEDELKLLFNNVIEYVMNSSIKNNDMNNSLKKYTNIINILNNHLN